jgi:hypothetical protein
MKIFNLLLLIAFSAGAAAESYKYNTLMIKDYDEMSQLVQAHVKKARSISDGSGEDTSRDGEAIEELREALKLIFSRPNSDNMVAKLTPEVRRELVGFSAFEDTISGIAAEALRQIGDKNAPVSQQSTALFVLENILAEIRPEAASNADLRRVIERVADAKIKISDDVKKDRKVRSMFTTKNPSEEAERILKSLPKPPKEKK